MTARQIFLSYAQADDEVPEPGRLGWVRFFYNQLRVALIPRISGDLHFWRDVNDIEPDARFAREIQEALKQAMLMIAVVSPKYLERPWCKKELFEFFGLQTDTDEDTRTERIVKILKHNVPENMLPDPLRDRGRGYRFYEMDPDKRIELPYYMNGRLMQRYEQAYFEMINEITERLAARIRASAPALEAPAPAPEAPAHTVFVAAPPAGSSIREVYIALAACRG